MSQSQLALLAKRRFLPFFIVQFFGAFNDNLFKNALIALLTWRLAEALGLNVTLHLSIANAVFMLPFALIAPTAGQIADGVDKARMVRWVKGLEVVLMLIGAWMLYVQSLFGLYLLVFLLGTQSALFSPVKYGILPQYLTEKELLSGNALVQAANFIAILVGQIIGAIIVLWTHGTWWVAVITISAALLGWIASLFMPSAPAFGKAPKVDFLLPRAMVDVLREAKKYPDVFRSLLAMAWFWFLGATYMVLLPDYAKTELGGDNGVYTLLLVTFSIGVATGALLCQSCFRNIDYIRLAIFGALGIAVSSVGLFLASEVYFAFYTVEADSLGALTLLARPATWLILISLLILAASAGVYLTPLNVVLQRCAPPEQRGRMVAASNVIDAAAMVLSALMNVVLASLGLTTLWIYLAIGSTGVFVAWYCWHFAKNTAFKQ